MRIKLKMMKSLNYFLLWLAVSQPIRIILKAKNSFNLNNFPRVFICLKKSFEGGVLPGPFGIIIYSFTLLFNNRQDASLQRTLVFILNNIN